MIYQNITLPENFDTMKLGDIKEYIKIYRKNRNETDINQNDIRDY